MFEDQERTEMIGRQGQAGMTGGQERTEMTGDRENTEVAAWMRRVEETNEVQAAMAKKQYMMSMISAGCCACALLIVLICALVMMPKLFSTFEQVNALLGEMEVVVTNLEEASRVLAETDMEGMLNGVNRLVEDSQAGVAEAMEKISALDIDTMNEAIASLKAVVEPLAKLFRR